MFLGFKAESQVLFGLFPLALVAGLASFFSPCAFPLLPGIVAVNFEDQSPIKPATKGLISAAGVLVFLLLLGGVIAAIGVPLGNFLQANMSTVRGIIGAGLLYFGILQLRGTHFGWLERRAPQVGEVKSAGRVAFTFGFGYVLIGSGCTVPIMSGLVLGSFAAGGFANALLSFVIAGSVMALLMFLFMAYAGRVQVMPKAINQSTDTIKKLAGFVLIGIGLFYLSNAFFGWI